MNAQLIQELEDLIRPMAEALGLDLWGLDFATGGNSSILRVYVDTEDGVTIDECARLSRDVSVALDVEDIISTRYTLEVSSPGLDRKFFDPAQMVPYIGQNVSVALIEALDGRKGYSGKLVAVEAQTITIEDGEGTVTCNWDEIKKANLRYAFPVPGTKGKKG
ncbi:ribosome maturation factor RimP [Desulfobaculum xiamenense]|uniref:Ribosome maturation factor RimP n=1 Tax=Desulfobaculum xiamenense TaxID=995050 RepID=A0A846QIW9_9BACT|nr:ribosome maturation factor RimP [Desulfobaculum xiamenense]NJB66987.1 ribosome maturation factor RimP [Desulfobaculum xiamenense]